MKKVERGLVRKRRVRRSGSMNSTFIYSGLLVLLISVELRARPATFIKDRWRVWKIPVLMNETLTGQVLPCWAQAVAKSVGPLEPLAGSVAGEVFRDADAG